MTCPSDPSSRVSIRISTGGRGQITAYRIVLLCCLLTLFLLPAAAPAQGDVEAGDVIMKVVNGTTGLPAVAERILLQEHTMTMDEVADIRPAAPVVTMRDVPLVDGRAYLATVWFDDVPYYFEFRGRFLDQDTNTVHVFDATSETDGIVVSGMNLIFKKLGELITLETVLEVDNRRRPQQTATGATIELHIPAGATDLEAWSHRGASPTSLRTTRLGTDRLSLEVPLVSGINRIQVSLKAEWHSGFTIPVGCSLPVEAWSLLASPETLAIVSFDLEPDPQAGLPGVQRFVGPALEAGRALEIRVEGDDAPAPEGDLFASSPDSATNPAAAEKQDSGGHGLPVPLPLLLLGAVLVVILVAVRRRSR